MSLIRSQLNIFFKWPLLSPVANSVVQSLLPQFYDHNPVLQSKKSLLKLAKSLIWIFALKYDFKIAQKVQKKNSDLNSINGQNI